MTSKKQTHGTDTNSNNANSTSASPFSFALLPKYKSNQSSNASKTNIILKNNNNAKQTSPTIVTQEKKTKKKSIDNIYYAQKKCEVCNDSCYEDKLYLCEICDDAYHSFCTNPPRVLKQNEDFFCSQCKETLKMVNKPTKQSTLDKNNEFIDFSIKMCGICGIIIQGKMLGCPLCKLDFHIQCFPNNSLFCDNCSKIMNANTKTVLNNSKITDYFPIVKTINGSPYRLPKLSFHFKNIGKQSKAFFKLPIYTSEANKQIMMQSLKDAIALKGFKFDDNLYFPLKECPPSANDAKMEPYCQIIGTKDLEIFTNFKKQSEAGLYAPIIIANDPNQGMIVKALENIKLGTLICEYTGDVYPLRNVLFDKNDSIMELIHASSSSQSLAIVPKVRANIARFISGINNDKSPKESKQNVRSIRYNINGHIRVILYANKHIKQGAVLYYDYNQGGLAQYPTHEFI